MFGKEYYKHPEVLIGSFKKINETYKKKKVRKTFLFVLLQKIYIFLFGIPEIGFQIRFLHFARIFKNLNKKPKNVLDLGSGIGNYSLFLAKKLDRPNIEGWDISGSKNKFSSLLAKELKINNVHFFKKNLLHIKKINKRFDLVIMIDVLEHINNYKLMLKKTSLLLKKGGYFYLHVPQPNQKRIFPGLKKWHHDDHVHDGFKLCDLKKELEKNKLKIVCSRQTFGWFGKFAWELNHLSLSKNFLLSGLIFPVLYPISIFDLFFKNKNGLGLAILARKV